ncbi:hypothetical protein [Nocardia sp. NPDC050710]|uniref:hypothetical protein n=1 Tax=Nocardia sp. NPDC050710 TaxID=3157220 RepID=UPI003405DADB
MPDEQSPGNSEIAALAHRVATARGKLPLQHDAALVDVLSDAEIAAERELAEWIRAQRRGQRRRAVQDELIAEKRDRRSAAAVRRVDEADARWHRRALAARRRVANQDARLAQLYRRAEWSSRALIGVVVLGMVWAGVNVQHNLVPSGDMSDPLYWLSYGIEAMISIPIITIMVVATTAARWGRELPRGKVVFFETALLGTTIALNAGPHLASGQLGKAAEYSIAPLMVGVVIWLHAWVSARYAQLIDSVPIVDDTAAPKLYGSIYDAPSPTVTAADRPELPAERRAESVAESPAPDRAPRESAGDLDPVDDPVPYSMPLSLLNGGLASPEEEDPLTRYLDRTSARPRNGRSPRSTNGAPTNGTAPHVFPGDTRNNRRINGNGKTNGHGNAMPSMRTNGHTAQAIFAPYPIAVDEGSLDEATLSAHTIEDRTESLTDGAAPADGYTNGHAAPLAFDRATHARNTDRRGVDLTLVNGFTAVERDMTGESRPADLRREESRPPEHETAAPILDDDSGSPHHREGSRPSESKTTAPILDENSGSPHRGGKQSRPAEGETTAPILDGNSGSPYLREKEARPSEGRTTAPATEDADASPRHREKEAHPAQGKTTAPTTEGNSASPHHGENDARPADREPAARPSEREVTRARSAERKPPSPAPTTGPLIPLEDLPTPPTRTTGEGAGRKAQVRTTTEPAPDIDQLALDEDPGPEPRHPRITLDAIAAARNAVEEFEAAEIPDASIEPDGDVEIWSVARGIADRGLSRIPVEQIAEILTLADQSWTPAGIGNEVGVPTSTVARVIDSARKVRRPYAPTN